MGEIWMGNVICSKRGILEGSSDNERITGWIEWVIVSFESSKGLFVAIPNNIFLEYFFLEFDTGLSLHCYNVILINFFPFFRHDVFIVIETDHK